MRELDTVVQDATAGDPISGLKWTHKSLRKISRALRGRYPLSAPTISRLLRLGRYSLRVNRKRLAGRQSPGRDEQFGSITRVRQAFLRHQRPVIRVDTKKKELVGNFRNPGRVWGQEVREVKRNSAQGAARCYANTGWIPAPSQPPRSARNNRGAVSQWCPPACSSAAPCWLFAPGFLRAVPLAAAR